MRIQACVRRQDFRSGIFITTAWVPDPPVTGSAPRRYSKAEFARVNADTFCELEIPCALSGLLASVPVGQLNPEYPALGKR